MGECILPHEETDSVPPLLLHHRGSPPLLIAYGKSSRWWPCINNALGRYHRSHQYRKIQIFKILINLQKIFIRLILEPEAAPTRRRGGRKKLQRESSASVPKNIANPNLNAKRCRRESRPISHRRCRRPEPSRSRSSGENYSPSRHRRCHRRSVNRDPY
jgi:hypothetical protein